jgi:hypothetical protein
MRCRECRSSQISIEPLTMIIWPTLSLEEEACSPLMRPRQLPQTPQDCSTNHILHVSHGGNLYMSHPSQPTATSIPLATPSARVYSSLTPNYTPLLHVYSPKLLFHCTKNDASMTRHYCPLAAQPLKQIIRYILRLLPQKLNGYKKYWTN